MPNYLIQAAPWRLAGSRFRIVKTQVDISFDGYLIETDVGLAKPFETEYFPTRKAAMKRRAQLIVASDEPIFGVIDFFYIKDKEVTEWFYKTGRLIGLENPDAWFGSLTRHEKSFHKLVFKEAQVRANQGVL